jgi:sigma-B regulation protein RsbU (phosphoserine phosphatase)
MGRTGFVAMRVPPGSASIRDRLRDIQSITDAALSRLDDHAFLAELLERARSVLEADTAAALLMDHSARQLIATAAAGLEEEVRQGVRIPVGRGFAGRIAAEKRPVILDHVDHTTVLNPILWSRGIHALLGVPMMVGGEVIGVLHVGSLKPREFTGEDVELLQLAADRAAVAMHSLMGQEDKIAAIALQRSLLPSALPVIAGAQLAARYVPGEGTVGGDWYDVFTLPSGQLGVVIGDVTGSGLPAAVIMGRMRSALRAYALDSTDPAEVLARLDAKMQHFEPGALATVSYAIFDPGLESMRISLGGHYPPVIAAPGEPATLAEIPPGLLIGAVPGADRRTVTIGLSPGMVVCFYTDGLVERRNVPIDDRLDLLCRSVTGASPDVVCANVMGSLIGAEPVRDDVALVVFRREPAEPVEAQR